MPLRLVITRDQLLRATCTMASDFHPSFIRNYRQNARSFPFFCYFDTTFQEFILKEFIYETQNLGTSYYPIDYWPGSSGTQQKLTECRMSGVFDTSSADNPKQLQQKQHTRPQQQHRANNNRAKAVQQFVGEPAESKSARVGQINRAPTPGSVTAGSAERDGSDDGCFNKQFFSKPSSIVNLEVHHYFPYSPFPAHSSAHLVQHSADEVVKGNSDKRTAIATTEAAENDNNNSLVTSNGPSVAAGNYNSSHRPSFYFPGHNNRPPIIPSRSRDQGVNAVRNFSSTLSLATPSANHCIKEETVEPNKQSEQLPQVGEFAVPAVPARLKAAAVSVFRPPSKKETSKEQLFLGENSKPSTSAVIVGLEGGRSVKEEPIEEQGLGSAAGTPCKTATKDHRTASAKPFRLAFRVSAAAALKLRRVAQNHARALRRLGISTVQFDQRQFGGNSGFCSLSLPSSLSQTRQQQLFQQQQRLQQLSQQQLVVVAQQFRGQPSAEIYSPSKAPSLHRARLAPPSVAAIPATTYPFHHPPVIHQSMDRQSQQQPGPSNVPITPANSVVAENSPLLVNLLSNAPPNQHQQNTIPPQQLTLASQQRFVGNAGVSMQQTPNPSALALQQQQYQQQLYQQQQIQHHRIQQAQQQSTMLFGPGGVPAVAGQMHPHHTAIMMTHQQIRPHGMPGGAPPPPHGMVPMPGACGMPPPYAMLPQQQQSASTAISAAKVNVQGAEVEEPPKKRKRISKKQQQKEEKEREQQQLRLQQEAAMVQMQRQQQQMYLQQRQMAMQQQGIAPVPSQGVIGTPQQSYQQQMAQYQQHYAAQQSNQQNVFNSPPPGNATGGHYANQQNTPSQPSPQQYSASMGAQSAMHYMSPPGVWGTSPQQQQQNLPDYQQQSQMTVTGQTPSNAPALMHMPSQQQQHFRTPGTPGSVGGGAMCYGHSPAATTCSTSTPFHSPPPQQQMVGTPSGGHQTPMGGGPTPPYGNSQGSAGSVQQQQQSQRGTPVGSGGSTVEHSRTNTPQQQQQQPFGLHSVQQHNAQPYQQGPPSHQTMQQMSPADFYQQQKTAQTKQMLQQPLITQQQYQSQSASTSVFPQLSDFAEDGLVDDLVVPSISNEDDFDLDSIEPMRYGDQQQGYHHSHQHVQAQQHQHNHQRVPQQQQNVFAHEQMQLMMQQQQQQQQRQPQSTGTAAGDGPRQLFQVQQQMLNQQQQQMLNQQQQQMLNQQQQQMAMCQQQRRPALGGEQQYQSPITVRQQVDEVNHIEMSAEDKLAAEMEMLPDRSPQLGDKPLSPSKLSETQDRNVTDAIASVMERVAKASFSVGNSGGKTAKSKGHFSKRGSLNIGNSGVPSNQQQSAGQAITSAASSVSFQSSAVSRTPTPQTPNSSGMTAVASTTGVSVGFGGNCGEHLATMERKQQPFGGGGSSYPPSLQQQSQQQRSADVLPAVCRPFSYPAPGVALAENGNGVALANSLPTRSGYETTSGSNSPFQTQSVQQALADSSTSASTTPTTASSVGGGPSAQFNGHFHATTTMQFPPTSNSISPPAQRKAPLSAPRTIESMRFELDSCHQLISVKQPQTSQRKRRGDKGGDGGEQQQQHSTKRKASKDSKGIGGPNLAVATVESNSSKAPASTTTVSKRTP
uniref:Uncharacterized protein n=1 Tax=Globodera rostochiensis TaxID=31243 RepID=A0A914HMC6_GLORO